MPRYQSTPKRAADKGVPDCRFHDLYRLSELGAGVGPSLTEYQHEVVMSWMVPRGYARAPADPNDSHFMASTFYFVGHAHPAVRLKLRLPFLVHRLGDDRARICLFWMLLGVKQPCHGHIRLTGYPHSAVAWLSEFSRDRRFQPQVGRAQQTPKHARAGNHTLAGSCLSDRSASPDPVTWVAVDCCLF